MGRVRLWLWILFAFVAVAAAFAVPTLWAIGKAGSGYKAKILCSSVFVSGRTVDSVLAEDASVDGYETLRTFSQHVDREKREVTASYFGLAGQRAVYREGLGCTLANNGVEGLKSLPPVGGNPHSSEGLWPDGEQVELNRQLEGVNRQQLDDAVAAAFDEPNPQCLRRTRALVVVHGGRIVAERYAPGFDAAMPLLGWSLSKTALNLLTGALVKRGVVGIEDSALMPEWSGEGDERAAITVDDLLRMKSGLIFDEDYNDELSDVVTMLFRSRDSGGYAAHKPLEFKPGAHLHYSSGDSNILSAALKYKSGDIGAYQAWPRELLFQPLGMKSAVFETDASGTIVGASFMYASARDWARLGLLMLRDGVWKGERIVPEGWVDYSLRPKPGSPPSRYGVHLWLDLPDYGVGPDARFPDDAYFMQGHESQIVAVVPSRDLVIVRLGLARCPGAWNHTSALGPIVAAFPETAGE